MQAMDALSAHASQRRGLGTYVKTEAEKDAIKRKRSDPPTQPVDPEPIDLSAEPGVPRRGGHPPIPCCVLPVGKDFNDKLQCHERYIDDPGMVVSAVPSNDPFLYDLYEVRGDADSNGRKGTKRSVAELFHWNEQFYPAEFAVWMRNERKQMLERNRSRNLQRRMKGQPILSVIYPTVEQMYDEWKSIHEMREKTWNEYGRELKH